jgi:4-amino-4-deoxy-L-arabinose transferase-like glycosyltransferase
MQAANSERAIELNDKRNVREPRLSTWLRDHVYLASILVLIASLLPRLFLTLSSDLQELKTSDTSSYFRNVTSYLEHGAFLDKWGNPDVLRTPGYAVFLLAIMAVTGTAGEGLNGEDLRTVLVVQTIIASWSVVFLYWLARRILPPVVALIGALLAAFSPWGAVRAGLAMTEGLYLLNLAALFFLMYLVVEHTRKLSAVVLGGVLIGLLTSAAVLVRPLWPLVIFVAVALFLLCEDRRKKAWVLVVVMLISAASPLYLWKARNQRLAQFDGLSIISGINAYQYLAPSVKAQLEGAEGDRWVLSEAARKNEWQWSKGLSVQERNDERWRRANAFFREHPFLTVYTFGLNAGQALIHPHPQILEPAGLNFTGDTWVLAGLWVTLLILAGIGLCFTPNGDYNRDMVQRRWLIAVLGICLSLTLASGIVFGNGSRLRAPMELIVPLLAALGLMRIINILRRN